MTEFSSLTHHTMPDEETLEVVEETPTAVVEPETTEEPSEDLEPSEETPSTEVETLLAGKYKSVEELEKAYLDSNSSATRMAAELKSARQPAQPVDTQTQEVVDQLKKYGVAFKTDIEQSSATMTQKQKDDNEIASLGLNSEQERILRQVASHQDNLARTMTEIWQNDLTSMGGNKVVSKKTTIKPKAGSKTTGTKVLTPSELAKLPEKEYNEYWKKKAAEQTA